jgi:TRAP-type transport system periplasmic protein
LTEVSRRHFLAVSTGAVGLAAGWIQSAHAQAQARISLRVSSSMPANKLAAHFAWFEQFQMRLKDTLGDRIELNYFPSGQLGDESGVVEQVKVGSIDIMISGSSIWATVAPELGMLDQGYIFDSFPRLAKELDASVGNELAKILADRTNVTILGWGFSFGARNVYTKKAVSSLSDLKDVKIRVLPTPAFIETFKLMGAIPTPLAMNDLYMALQTGVVDGLEHDAGTVLAGKFYEVAKQCFLTEHLFSPIVAAIGKRGFDKITPDIRPAFLKAAAEASAHQRGTAIETANGAIEQLKQLGVVFAPMPQDQRSAVQKLMAEKLYPPFYGRYPVTKPIFDIIAASRAA